MSEIISPQEIWSGSVPLDSLLNHDNALVFYTFVQKRKVYVYVMGHPEKGTLLKIGLTTKTPYERAKSLETAGVLGSFEVLWSVRFANASWAEAKVHRLLSQYHVEKEFFDVDLDTVKKVLGEVLFHEEQALKHLQRDVLMTRKFDVWLDNLDVTALIDLY